MLIRLFKGNIFTAYFLIAISFAVMCLQVFDSEVSKMDSLAFESVFELIRGMGYLPHILIIVEVTFIAYVVFKIILVVGHSSVNSLAGVFFTYLFFAFLLDGSFELEFFSAFAGLFFLLFYIIKIYLAGVKEFQSLNSGVFLGLIVLIDWHFIVFVLWLVLGFTIIKSIKWRDSVYVILGTLIPLFYFAVVRFLLEGQDGIEGIVVKTTFGIPDYFSNSDVLIKTGALALLTFPFVIPVVLSTENHEVKTKTIYAVVFWAFLFSILMIFISGSKGTLLASILVYVPLMISGFFKGRNSWFLDLLTVLLIALEVI